MLWRDQQERIAVGAAAQFQDPFAYVADRLDEFDRGLEFDPEQSADAVADRRARELLEEVA